MSSSYGSKSIPTHRTALRLAPDVLTALPVQRRAVGDDDVGEGAWTWVVAAPVRDAESIFALARLRRGGRLVHLFPLPLPRAIVLGILETRNSNYAFGWWSS